MEPPYTSMGSGGWGGEGVRADDIAEFKRPLLREVQKSGLKQVY